jgi:phosphoserine phosphatase
MSSAPSLPGGGATGRIAAIFDLDGTLFPEPSLERRFFSELRRNSAVPFANYLRWGVEAVHLLPRGFLAGVNTAVVFRYLDSISFFDEGVARVAWHARQKHEIVLLTGTLEPLARLAAMALECELEDHSLRIQPWICATQLAERRGRWTGFLVDEAVWGPAKARAIENLARNAKLDLRQSHAYGNSPLDRDLLCAVGHAHAVNPGKTLAALANENDWPIWHWHIEKRFNAKGHPHFASEIHHFEGRA